MKKSLLYLLFCFILVYSVSGVFASVSLNIIQPTGTLDVIKDQTFNILVNISCSGSDCNNFSAGLKIPNLETKTITFPDISPNDCFDGTCLATPEGGGPIYFESGQGVWGCGKCFSGPIWAGSDIRQLVDVGCVTGMKFIAGVNLCFAANNGKRWDFKFNSWPVGGIGKTIYTRSIEKGLLSTSPNSLPFYISSGENLLILSLTSGESKTINFSVNANGNIGSYSNLVLFASDSELILPTLNIKAGEIITPINNSVNTTNNYTESQPVTLPLPVVSTTSHRSSNRNKNIARQIDNSSTIVNITQQENSAIELKSLTENSSINKFPKIVYLLEVLALIVLLIIFIILIFKRRSKFY